MLAPRDRATMLTYAVLLLVTAAAWASMLWSPMDADEMAGTGMVMAPSVGEAVAFVAAWGVMMAAMMLPSALPMIGLYAASQRSAPSPAAKAAAIAAFVLMYLVVWAVTGLPIYFASVALMAVASVTLAYAIAGVLVVAGLFQLSPLKQVCLRRCRSPLGFLLGSWRGGRAGALRMGARNGAWCVGCCWALMASLFALGVMSIAWMAFVAGLIAVEKTLPWRRVATWGTAALLLAVGLVLFVAPDALPTLTTAGSSPMPMGGMGP